MKAAFCGVDIGGSKTELLYTDEKLVELGAERHRTRELGSSLREVGLNIRGKLSRAEALQGIGVASTGVWKDDEKCQLAALFEGIAPLVAAFSDIEAARHGAFEGGAGTVVIAGTGSAAYGQSSKGKAARAGGLGSVFGDEGSGYWLGKEAVNAALRSAEGRDDETALTTAILAGESPRDFVKRFAEGGYERSEIAAIAEVVFDCAKAGDDTAGEIVRQGAKALAELAMSVNLRLEERLAVSWQGGLFAEPYFADRVREQLDRRNVLNYPPRRTPAWGAALMAREAV